MEYVILILDLWTPVTLRQSFHYYFYIRGNKYQSPHRSAEQPGFFQGEFRSDPPGCNTEP